MAIKHLLSYRTLIKTPAEGWWFVVGLQQKWKIFLLRHCLVFVSAWCSGEQAMGTGQLLSMTCALLGLAGRTHQEPSQTCVLRSFLGHTHWTLLLLGDLFYLLSTLSTSRPSPCILPVCPCWHVYIRRRPSAVLYISWLHFCTPHLHVSMLPYCQLYWISQQRCWCCQSLYRKICLLSSMWYTSSCRMHEPDCMPKSMKLIHNNKYEE